MAELAYLTYAGAVGLGLLHGSDPGHGWPLAALKARGRGAAVAAAYTLILSLGHFTSTVAVVAGVWLLGRAMAESLWLLQAAAGSALLALGAWSLYRLRAGDGEGHGGGPGAGGAWDMFKYSLLLGFAHEEEVALSAMVLLGANPLLLSAVYGASVTAAMLAWALAAFAFMEALESRLGARLERALHAASAGFLLAVGAYVLQAALAQR